MRFRNPAVVAGLLVGLFFLSVYLFSGSSDLKHNGDTDLRYQTTQALVEHGQIWVAHPMWLDDRMVRGRGGHRYPYYAPGQIFAMVPLYILGRAVAHHFALPYDVTTLYFSRSLDLFLGAALAVVFYCMALAAGYRVRAAAVLTLVFGLATAVWPDAQSGLEQTQVDLFLLLAVYCVWRFARGDLTDRRWLVGAGLAVAVCVFTRYDATLYVPIVGLFPTGLRLALRRRGIVRDWLAYGPAVLPGVLGLAVWDWARFGNPLYTGLTERTFGEPFLQGFLGLVVSPGKGLLWYMPIVLLLPWAVPMFARRAPALAVFFAVLVAAPLAFYSQVFYWHGDPAWGPRYLYVALPYLVLPLGEILLCWRRRPATLKLAALGLLAVSFVLQAGAISVTPWRFWYRLEVTQQRTANVDTWAGQPFRWGATRYQYYWNLAESPILMQFEDLYQVLRLDSGDRHYLLTAQADPYVSNPADNYPLNAVAYWWADPVHPLFGARVRTGAAILLALTALLSLTLLLAIISQSRPPGLWTALAPWLPGSRRSRRRASHAPQAPSPLER